MVQDEEIEMQSCNFHLHLLVFFLLNVGVRCYDYVIIALFEAFSNLVFDYDHYQHHNSKGRLNVDAGDWRAELKYEGNGSLSLQLDHKWHHCHHLVLISFHLSAPPLQAISGY